ncbi:MAG: lamin tail domain-containing protein, partial [Planctomycetales bacterium]|nr:lamin tail domain-containing protein [Planctomycetales bacterium]
LLDLPASAANLRISEINYNPHAPLTQFGEADVDNDEFEFIELLNVGNVTIDLTNVELQQVDVEGSSEGIAFRFATQTLAPGERIVVVENRAAFQSRYGTGIRVAEAADTQLGTGIYSGSLSNSGERLTLVDAQGAIIQQFDYNDTGAWPGRADGGASSLEIVDPSEAYDDPGNWRNSNEFGGSPGTAGTGSTQTVVINELLTHTDLPQIDTIELHNTTGQAIDIARWYLSDGSDDYLRYQIPVANGTLAAGGYRVLTEVDLGFGFRGEASDDAWLISADVLGKPLRFVDHVEFGATQNGTSLGRWPNGTGDLFPMTALTLGSANSGPALADIVLSEVEYNPSTSATLLANEGEFVEVWNRGSATTDISHWRLNVGVDFDFAAGTALAADARIVVVSFDPTTGADKATAFRQHYHIGNDVMLVGPFSGRLDDAGDTVELERPEDVAQLGLGYVLVDRIAYESTAPWPNTAAGLSLQRTVPTAYGDFSTSWQALAASPGGLNSAEPNTGDFNSDGQVDVIDVQLLCAAIRSPNPSSEFDIDSSGETDFDDMRYLIGEVLHTSFGDANLDGVFNSTDLILVFQAGEYEDGIADNSSWSSGDWDCDGEFTTADLVLAFQGGSYTSEATRVVAAQPAVSAIDLALAALYLKKK